MSGERRLELAPDEEVHPRQQDGRHGGPRVALCSVETSVEDDLERGLDLARAGEYFAAHEALEDAWRAAEPAEKDFFQGLVHVVVAWYQAGRGNEVGCTRQLQKAARRLGPFAPEHRGVEVAALLRQVEAAQAKGTLDLDPLEIP
jgi:predicted metal-dependent hydrolase